MPVQTLDFDPALPWPLALPWPGQWGAVHCVFDLYRVEGFLDDEAAYMAANRQERRVLDVRLKEIQALPDGADKAEQETAYTTASRAQRRANCLLQITYFVTAVRWPDGHETPTADVDWTRFPLKLLEWIADTGYALAREELWGPKAPTPFLPPSETEN